MLLSATCSHKQVEVDSVHVRCVGRNKNKGKGGGGGDQYFFESISIVFIRTILMLISLIDEGNSKLKKGGGGEIVGKGRKETGSPLPLWEQFRRFLSDSVCLLY